MFGDLHGLKLRVAGTEHQLRVVRVDGRPLTRCGAVIRNLVKLAPPLLVLDTLLMLIAFGADKQRLSDKLAGTIVVRARAQESAVTPSVRLA